MDSSWIMTGVGLVKKIRSATELISLRLGELVAQPYIKCPNCEWGIDTSNVSLVWPALPSGVKFDPSDIELLQHLKGKSLNSKSNALINEFIPTIEEKEGICYTHPKNLPGIKMDGSSLHFFHRISNAYDCGHRKRRKINVSDKTRGDDDSVCDDNIRWHKTGRSRAIYDENGVKKGWKKILVLYKGSKRGGRDNWVMHQYHLGAAEDEEDGEFVVSKVFYQLSKKNDKSDNGIVESEASAGKIDPRTPKTDPPQPRLPNNSPSDTEQNTPIQEGDECGTYVCPLKVEAAAESSAWFAELSPTVVFSAEPRQSRNAPDAGPEPETPIPADGSNTTDLFNGLPELNTTSPCLATPSDSISLADLQFGSQDSFGGWLDMFY